MLRVEGDYARDGYAVVRECVSPPVARALLGRIQADSKIVFVPDAGEEPHPMLSRTVFELYGNQYPSLQTFLWALTGVMEQLVGTDLLPTFDFFRLYREGDICRVHSDRPACEHSLSLAVAYSDDRPWPIELGTGPVPEGVPAYADDFGGEPSTAFTLQVGDALAYRGPRFRHGRTVPNANRWSAHLFLFWVEKDGPHANEAFDRRTQPEPIDFTFF